MLEMTTFNARKNRWVLAMPDKSADRDQAVILAHYLGWTIKEIADDWRISITRVQQIEKRGRRRNKLLIEILTDASK